MREVEIKVRCDVCREDATQTFVVGIAAAESRPVLRLVDVCEEHAAPYLTVAELVANAPAFDSTSAPRPPRAAQTPRSEGGRECELCGERYVTRQGLKLHIWRDHAGDPEGNEGSLVCRECGRTFSTPQGTGRHRASVHGVDTLEEAYAVARDRAKKKA